MASSRKLKDFGEDLNNLIPEVHRSLRLIGQLDTRAHHQMLDVDEQANRLMESIINSNISNDQKIIEIKKIQTKYNLIIGYADDKVQVATQCYELVDKYIQNLDRHLKESFGDIEQYAENKLPVITNHKSPSKSSHSGGSTKDQTSPKNLMFMDVDPNEPTYCLCMQVSFGEMIGCDNSDCAIEWFHFSCVGLTKKPKGKWYCPNCGNK